MGRQINFYMLQDDIREFEQMIQKKGGIAFVPEQLPDGQIITVNTLTQKYELNGRKVQKTYLVQEHHLENLKIQPIGSSNLWYVDNTSSLAVEFMKSTVIERQIHRGRLYFEAGYFEPDGQWSAKPEDFVRWADSLIRWIRTHYAKDDRTQFYVGPNTQKMIEAGDYTLVHQ